MYIFATSSFRRIGNFNGEIVANSVGALGCG